MKIIICLILLLAFSPITYAENLCSKVESKGEGHLPIPESAFNLENAVKARERLNKSLIEMELNFTPFTLKNSVGLYGEVKTDLIMIEGYILRSQAIDGKAKGKNDGFVKIWCDFFESEAVVWH